MKKPTKTKTGRSRSRTDKSKSTKSKTKRPAVRTIVIKRKASSAQKVARKARDGKVNKVIVRRRSSGKTGLKRRSADGNQIRANRQDIAEPTVNDPEIRSRTTIRQRQIESPEAASGRNWKLTTKRKKIVDIFHPTHTTYYTTRDDAMNYFRERVANSREIWSVWLSSPGDIHEDLKLDGIIVATPSVAADLPSKDGRWRI
jgi:hypothetical protein